MQVRDCEEQTEPYGTLAVRYAVFDCPFAIVVPLNEHDAAVATLHAELVYVPLNTPLVHVRVCATDEQSEPYGTEEDWYAVTDCPLGIVCPSQVQEVGVEPATQEA